MKSKVISLSALERKVGYFTRAVYDDRLTVYAAQCSFFICISVIPFAVLVLSLARALAPSLVINALELLRSALPVSSRELFDTVVEDASGQTILPTASVTALATLWSAAKGLRSVVLGLSEVYGTRARGTYFLNIVRGLVFTVLFIAAIALTLILLVVIESADKTLCENVFPHVVRSGYRVIFIFAVLTSFFSLLYFFAARGSFFPRKAKKRSDKAPTGFISHLAGASVASAGWIVYSFFYSVYLKYFTGSSHIYGSLAAVVVFMLWIYFCAVIFLFGAEINKYIHESAKK